MDQLSQSREYFRKLFTPGSCFKKPFPQRSFNYVNGNSSANAQARQVGNGKESMPVKRTKYL